MKKYPTVEDEVVPIAIQDTNAGQTEQMTADMIHANIRDLVLSEIKAAPTHWSTMPQQMQEEMIDRIDQNVSNVIKNAVNAMVAHQFPLVTGELDSVTVKDEIKAVVKISKHSEGLHDVIDAVGASIRMIVVDTDDFETGEGKIEADLNQRPLPLDDGPVNIF